MNLETYNQAKSVMDKIDLCNRGLSILFTDSTTVKPIRFGGHYNVSSPIDVSEETYKKIKELIRIEKQELLGELDEQFEKII